MSLLEVEAEALLTKVVQLALDGDPSCLRICLERLVPVKKDAPIRIDIPENAGAADIPKLLGTITARLREGGLTPPETVTPNDLADAFRKSFELVELEYRLSALEEKYKS
jgi:hypothetical protein